MYNSQARSSSPSTSVRSKRSNRESSPTESVQSTLLSRDGSVPAKRLKRETLDLQTQASLLSQSQYKRATYPEDRDARFAERQKWGPLTSDVMLDIKNILADAYEDTLNDIPGVSQENVDKKIKEQLRICARSINKALKRLLLPGEVDPNLLDPSTHELKVQQRKEYKEKKLALGKTILYKEHCEEELEKKREQLEILRKKVQQEKDRLINNPLQTEENQDYFQSLLRTPSTSVFTHK